MEGRFPTETFSLFFLLSGTLRDALMESFLPILRPPANLNGVLLYEEFHRFPPKKQYFGDQHDLCL